MCKESIIKNFQELYSKDVSQYVEKKKSGGSLLSYLTWSYAWAEFKKIYPDAFIIALKNGNPIPIDIAIKETTNNQVQ